jgi:hypothetical protein
MVGRFLLGVLHWLLGLVVLRSMVEALAQIGATVGEGLARLFLGVAAVLVLVMLLGIVVFARVVPRRVGGDRLSESRWGGVAALPGHQGSPKVRSVAGAWTRFA